MIKPTMSSSGKGQSVVATADSVEVARERAKSAAAMVKPKAA